MRLGLSHQQANPFQVQHSQARLEHAGERAGSELADLKLAVGQRADRQAAQRRRLLRRQHEGVPEPQVLPRTPDTFKSYPGRCQH